MYEWIEYSISDNAVFCFACRHFGGLSLGPGERSGARPFIERGFTFWKNMHSQLKEHTERPRHRDAVKAWADYKDVCAGKKPSKTNQSITNNRTAEVNEN